MCGLESEKEKLLAIIEDIDLEDPIRDRAFRINEFKIRRSKRRQIRIKKKRGGLARRRHLKKNIVKK